MSVRPPDCPEASPDGTGAIGADDDVVRIYYANVTKNRRGLMLIVAALGVAVWLVRLDPALDMTAPGDMAILVLTVVVLFAVLAFGIERLFGRAPSLIVRRSGLVLIPSRRPATVLAWRDIRGIEVYRFGKGRLASSHFFSIVVDEPSLIGRHLPLVQRLAFGADRAFVGENRYFRAKSDFEQPVAEVVADLEAFREKFG